LAIAAVIAEEVLGFMRSSFIGFLGLPWLLLKQSSCTKLGRNAPKWAWKTKVVQVND
jgi:hypothetical protein